jgi:hypothetical protein
MGTALTIAPLLDHVDIMIHNYRRRLQLASGDQRYALLEHELQQYPEIAVPSITIGSDFDGPGADGAHYRAQFTGKYAHRTLQDIGHNVSARSSARFRASDSRFGVTAVNRRRLCRGATATLVGLPLADQTGSSTNASRKKRIQSSSTTRSTRLAAILQRGSNYFPKVYAGRSVMCAKLSIRSEKLRSVPSAMKE